MPLGDKFKLLRKKEDLSQRAFCELVGVPPATLANLEKGRNKSISVDFLSQVVKHPRFTKYAIWLLVDELTNDQLEETVRFARQLSSTKEETN